MSQSSSERRRQILDAAKRLFKHYGIGKTTVADIAREAGVGVGTVYLEFDSKDSIVAELSIESHACMLAAMRKAALGRGDYARRLEALLDRRLARFLEIADDGQHGLDLVRCACEAARAAHARFRAAEEELLCDLLEAACEAGEFATTDPRRTARVLLRLYDGYAKAAVEGQGRQELRREIAQAYVIILNGLLVRRG
ncbi:TetR/AcrR family transcriptional regulator [Haliangium sp.]|uniref:TetR/AcrR family transcriptional regulator n=1 Tax=Haliangium sp. TaxID=2663208 RepID=UPI003D0CBAD6